MMLKIVVVLCALVQLSVSAGNSVPCNGDVDCPDGYCCVPFSFRDLGRRRFILDSFLRPNQLGNCRALGQQGQTCLPESLHHGSHGAFIFGCPCAQGLECHGEKESHNGGSHSYTNPKCIPAGTYTTEASETGNPSISSSTPSQ